MRRQNQMLMSLAYLTEPRCVMRISYATTTTPALSTKRGDRRRWALNYYAVCAQQLGRDSGSSQIWLA